jgi:hypothetical protein
VEGVVRAERVYLRSGVVFVSGKEDDMTERITGVLGNNEVVE